LRDKDLVRTFQEQRQRPPIFGWLMLMLGATLTFILLMLSGISLYNNYHLLETAKNRGGTVLNNVKADVNTNLLTKNPEQATTEIQAIENLRLLMVDLDEYERGYAPIYLGMGLYSGDKIYREKLLPIYYSALGRRFVEPTMRRVEDDLRKFAASPPVKNAGQLTQEEEDFLGKHYDLLKVYLMLTDKYRNNATDTEIFNKLKDYWFTESKLPESLRGDAENQLKFYAKQVTRFEGPARFPRIQPNGNLVIEVRNKLKVFPPFQRYYRRKVTEISKEIEAKNGIMSVDAILQRNSADAGFLEGSFTVESAYTRDGFKLMEKAILTSAKELGSCDWVLEETCNITSQVSEIIESPDAAKIRDRYFRDYADQWRNFVKGVKVKPYTKVTARDALSSFSSSSSPMKILLKEIEKHTNLGKKSEKGWFETIKGWFSSETIPDTGGNSQVEREFRPLFTFVEDTGDKNKQVPVDEYRKYIESVSTKYSSFTDNEINELGALKDDERNQKFPQLKTAIGDIDKITKTFKDLPYFVDLLKQPVGNLSVLLGADSVKQLGERWKNEVLPLARKAEQGYPFDPASETNADFSNLKEYFGTGKGLTKFYEDNKKHFEGTPGQIKFKDPNSTPFNQEFLDYLNKALVLRQALFSQGDDVKFSYDFELTSGQDAVVEMTIDGITISSVEKPSAKIDFPSSTGGGSGIIIKALSTSGTTSTSGTSSANNSSSSVNTSSSSNSTGSKFLQNSNSNSSSSDEKSFLGAWGLFRFMDASNAQKESDKIYRLSYRLKSGKIVQAKITAGGVDPFDKEIYKLRAPENILK
jgi:type VI secretion system protein ImpL